MKCSIAQMARELLAEELATLGAALQLADSGAAQPDPGAYRHAAVAATRILARHPKCPVLAEVVALNPALQDIRANLAFGRALALGLCELPKEVRRCFSAPGQTAIVRK